LGFLQNNFISEFFVQVFHWLNNIFHDYALAIIILTVAIRIIMIPLDIKQKKSSRQMAQIQPELSALKKRHANNQQMMQKKQQELYKQKGISPYSGCLPMLIQLPIFFAFFGSLRVLASEQMITLLIEAVNNGVSSVELPSWLWVNNLWQPDSGLSSILPDSEDFLKFLQQNMQYISPQSLSILQSEGLIQFNTTGLAITPAYETLSTQLIAANGKAGFMNGWFLLPIIAGASLFIQQKINTKLNPSMSEQQGGKMMLYFFPIFSIYICVISSAAFAIYWVAANLYALVQLIVVNKLLDKQDKKKKESVIVR
jgi:YidC/Oxa1 family membrane protein insertase